jgi:uncharacterized protein (DUF1778 family)
MKPQGPKTNRTARIEARIAPAALAIVRRAAEIQGRSVSDFVVAAAQEAAGRTIEETEILRLSVEDQRIIAEAILSGAWTNQRLVSDERGATAGDYESGAHSHTAGHRITTGDLQFGASLRAVVVSSRRA